MRHIGEEGLGEITLGKVNYIHKMDQQYDYLIDNSNNKIKVNLRFTRDPEKNEKAKKGLTTFFTGISS